MKIDPYKLILSGANLGEYLSAIMSNSEAELIEFAQTVSYTHLTLPTTPYV